VKKEYGIHTGSGMTCAMKYQIQIRFATNSLL